MSAPGDRRDDRTIFPMCVRRGPDAVSQVVRSYRGCEQQDGGGSKSEKVLAGDRMVTAAAATAKNDSAGRSHVAAHALAVPASA